MSDVINEYETEKLGLSRESVGLKAAGCLVASGPLLFDGSVWSAKVGGDDWWSIQRSWNPFISRDPLTGRRTIDRRPDEELGRAYGFRLASHVAAPAER